MWDIFAAAQMRNSIDAEIRDRITAHKRDMSQLEAARVGAHHFSAPLVNEPVIALAIGDSWFDYPLDGNSYTGAHTDIVAYLPIVSNQKLKVVNLAHWGETAVQEMSLPKQRRMTEVVLDKSNWLNGKPDVILISAGGNDIAGDNFLISLDFNDGHSTGLSAERFPKLLAAIEACYLELFAFRDRLAPGVPIVGHCYDIPIPNGVHPPCIGPWLQPSLISKNWPNAVRRDIVRHALTEFRDLLKSLEKRKHSLFFLAETHDTVGEAEWANELHPGHEGFAKLARKIWATVEHVQSTTVSNLNLEERAVPAA